MWVTKHPCVPCFNSLKEVESIVQIFYLFDPKRKRFYATFKENKKRNTINIRHYSDSENKELINDLWNTLHKALKGRNHMDSYLRLKKERDGNVKRM